MTLSADATSDCVPDALWPANAGQACDTWVAYSPDSSFSSQPCSPGPTGGRQQKARFVERFSSEPFSNADINRDVPISNKRIRLDVCYPHTAKAYGQLEPVDLDSTPPSHRSLLNDLLHASSSWAPSGPRLSSSYIAGSSSSSSDNRVSSGGVACYNPVPLLTTVMCVASSEPYVSTASVLDSAHANISRACWQPPCASASRPAHPFLTHQFFEANPELAPSCGVVPTRLPRDAASCTGLEERPSAPPALPHSTSSSEPLQLWPAMAGQAALLTVPSAGIAAPAFPFVFTGQAVNSAATVAMTAVPSASLSAVTAPLAAPVWPLGPQYGLFPSGTVAATSGTTVFAVQPPRGPSTSQLRVPDTSLGGQAPPSLLQQQQQQQQVVGYAAPQMQMQPRSSLAVPTPRLPSNIAGAPAYCSGSMRVSAAPANGHLQLTAVALAPAQGHPHAVHIPLPAGLLSAAHALGPHQPPPPHVEPPPHPEPLCKATKVRHHAALHAAAQQPQQQQQPPQQQQQLVRRVRPLSPSPPTAPLTPLLPSGAGPEDWILHAVKVLGMSEPDTARLALHCWRRVVGLPQLHHASRMWGSVSAGRNLYATACLWVSIKLEEKRRTAPGGMALAEMAATTPAALCSAELAVMNWLEWRPYDGYRLDESHLLVYM